VGCSAAEAGERRVREYDEGVAREKKFMVIARCKHTRFLIMVMKM
jgi:hypothetical protein